MARARRCAQCGAKLFPTDTFCGICGADVTEVNGTTADAGDFSSAVNVNDHMFGDNSDTDSFKEDTAASGFIDLEFEGTLKHSREDLLNAESIPEITPPVESVVSFGDEEELPELVFDDFDVDEQADAAGEVFDEVTEPEIETYDTEEPETFENEASELESVVEPEVFEEAAEAEQELEIETVAPESETFEEAAPETKDAAAEAVEETATETFEETAEAEPETEAVEDSATETFEEAVEAEPEPEIETSVPEVSEESIVESVEEPGTFETETFEETTEESIEDAEVPETETLEENLEASAEAADAENGTEEAVEAASPAPAVLAASAPESDPDAPSEYTSELSRLEAQLAEAEAEVVRLEKESKNAEREASIAAYRAEGDTYEPTESASEEESIWEESEKRAEQAQKDFERQQHRQLIKEGGAHNKRDIILLIAGIAALVIILGWLVSSSFKDIPGNDAYKQKAPEVVVETETYVPSDAGTSWDGTIAEGLANGSGAETDPYIISAGSELAYIASQINRGVTFDGVFFKLANDIDLNKFEWTPAGYYYEDADGEKIIAFSGVFDGDGHKITNLSITDLTAAKALDGYSKNIAVGLFGALNNATIKNLTIEGATIVASNDGGALYAGALAGYIGDSTILSCGASADITAKGLERTAAGILGGAIMGGTATEVTTSGSVNCLEALGTVDAGGLAGYTATADFSGLNITANVNTSGVLDIYVGGVSGYSDSSTTTASTITVSASAATTGEANAAMGGGICGAAHTGVDGDNTVNATLTISAVKSAYSGGFYGYAENVITTGGTAAATQNTSVTGADSRVVAGGVCGSASEYQLDGTVVSGTVTSSGTVSNSSGGILGFSANGSISNANTTVVTDATASAETASVMAGGIAGEINSGTYLNDAASGKINVTSAYNGYAGGAFGYINGGVFTNVNVNGAITNTSTNGVTSGGLCGYADGTINFTDCTGSTSRTNSGKNVYDSDAIAFDART
ncbi:MAG: hypothetical protein K5848_01585 [Lachnospiraceae bacterium]|nr:hypothetical protein [Lachnospiraceae bacterium]